MTRKQPTIQDVATQAGVSTATVSRALTQPHSVSEGKRQAVKDAIRSTGYRVNHAARNLRTQRANTVLALLPDLGNPFFSRVLQGIESVLTPEGLALVVAETNQIQRAGDDLVGYLDDQRADGIIIFDGGLPCHVLESLAAPEDEQRVIFACEWSNESRFPSVRSSNFDGAVSAVQYLYQLGHRHIAHVMGPKDNVLTAERREGFLDACKQLGIQYSLIEGAFTLEAGANAADELLKISSVPTGVFCASDTIAMGLISGLFKNGLTVPGDVSVFGFDDIELCEHFLPPISTIRQDRIALGAQAAHLLLRCLKQGPQPNRVERLPIELIARESCAERN